MTCWLRENGVVDPVGDIPYDQAQPIKSSFTLEACDGRIDPVHLIPKNLIYRKLRLRPTKAKDRAQARPIVSDPRIIVPGCRRHHHLLDVARKLRIARASLPPEVETFAAEYDFEGWLEREYGVSRENNQAATA